MLSVAPVSEVLFDAPIALSRFWKLLSRLEVLESDELLSVEEPSDEEDVEDDEDDEDSFCTRLCRSPSSLPAPPCHSPTLKLSYQSLLPLLSVSRGWNCQPPSGAG